MRQVNFHDFKFIFLATNIHTGGGLKLIKDLLPFLEKDTLLIIDKRSKLESSKNNIYFIRPNIFSRLLLELQLFKNLKKNQTLISFTNLPPVLQLKCRTFLFLQNALIINNFDLSNFGFLTKIRISAERFLFYLFKKNIDEYIVQTKYMHNLLKKLIQAEPAILPFYTRLRDTSGFIEKEYDFLYVADCLPHKNHTNLLLAFKELNKKGIKPSLCLTVDKNDSQWLQILKHTKSQSLNIRYTKFMSIEEKIKTYKRARYLIYPSLAESFGLPLLEAHDLKVPILASDLPFTNEYVSIEGAFNPNNVESIAESIENTLLSKAPYLAKNKLSHNHLISPKEFVQNIREF